MWWVYSTVVGCILSMIVARMKGAGEERTVYIIIAGLVGMYGGELLYRFATGSNWGIPVEPVPLLCGVVGFVIMMGAFFFLFPDTPVKTESGSKPRAQRH